jgi:hypothetical protein
MIDTPNTHSHPQGGCKFTQNPNLLLKTQKYPDTNTVFDFLGLRNLKHICMTRYQSWNDLGKQKSKKGKHFFKNQIFKNVKSKKCLFFQVII